MRFEGQEPALFSSKTLYSLAAHQIPADSIAIDALSCDELEGLTLSFNDGLIAVIDWQQLYPLSLNQQE
ncbi:hypothetical protein BGC07_07405 [Piscirickettsia litoralis]|uniref:Uncharacterized protein n=1 Tax=Piscirickettsia litoralis TaxID=1891921 RepID=A0ABX3A8X3_9GAMM|nr:hypothetical protein BGC07_07405 [Piscirickettsia litoralis]